MFQRAGALALFISIASCTKPGSGDAAAHDPTANPARARLAVTSETMQEGKPIPAQNACTDSDHLGTSPPLAWSGVPDGAQSIAITLVDPDAKSFVHWAVIGVPPTTASMPAGASPGGPLPSGATELPNDFGKPGYGGPCPPKGAPHHYVFTVYALRSAVQGDKPNRDFIHKLDENALASGTLTVTHQR